MRISFPFDFAIEDETTTKTTTKIIEILKENQNITANEIADEIGITRDGVFWHLKNLVKSEQIRHIGPTTGNIENLWTRERSKHKFCRVIFIFQRKNRIFAFINSN
jgi:predicted ArsR family transcriptional regulator